ncbi:MAG TPA: LytTR family DNA-binding domain-containing protein [Gemmatimonadales bacterium]|nr:LytTR family DNA-binding domain-containing protein [Gemmatimonadales bacterium]
MAEEPRPLRVLVVDDEPVGWKRIVNLLRAEPNVDLVGTAEDGEQAVEAIRTLRPDLVFLDIQMPRRTGLDVVREVGPDAMPATIFVTAYDQHALSAFELAAVDYLVKPYDDERFEQAFRRARRRVELEGRDQLLNQLTALLSAGRTPPGEAPPREKPAYLERIAVQTKGKIRVVPAAKIDYVRASGPYAELHVGDQRYVIRESMQALDERLDPAEFMRIHRSIIVRLSLIEVLARSPAGDLEAQLKNGVRLPVGRSRRDAVQRRLGWEGR